MASRQMAMEGDPSPKGLHVSPRLSNRIEEIDRFIEAVDRILDRLGSKLTQA